MFAIITQPGPTPWTRLTKGFAVQITAPPKSGAASSVTARMQRSTVGPNADGTGGNPAPVGPVITGDPAQLEPFCFEEPASVGFWRMVVTDLVGGGVAISIDGEAV
ncbi:MAG: hypothetical protein JWP35_3530 [Caulobacter sp.]|nr:hypothetical protein [Caulobacter sp.]